jgi:hypothetical protein
LQELSTQSNTIDIHKDYNIIINSKENEIKANLEKISELEDIKNEDEESLLFLENKIKLLQEQI